MTRIDPLLKTLQVRPSPPEALVQAYLIHVADRSDTNFRKILDLKGIRKIEQSHLVELFGIHRDAPGNEGRLVAQSPLLTPLMNTSGIGSSSNTGLGIGIGIGGIGGGLMSPAIQQGTSRFDAATFGEKLLSAARDGVERIGTPAAAGHQEQHGSGGGSGHGGVGHGGGGHSTNASINENLKKMGNFFRRDNFGLGARFVKRDSSVEDTGRRS